MSATSDAIKSAADALVRRVLDALPADRSHGRADLGDVPGPLAGLIRAQLNEAVERAAPSSRWLDPADDALRAATGAWRDAAEAAVAVPAADWEAVVRESARRALAHLVDPAETLTEAAFEGETEPMSVEEALSRIQAFGPYAYIPQITARYAERKGLDRLDRPGLQTLLQRIDRRMVGAFGPDDWITLLGPLFDLVGPTAHPPGSVPTALLRPLLQAKGADELADAFAEFDAVDAATVQRTVYQTMGAEEPADTLKGEADSVQAGGDRSTEPPHVEPERGAQPRPDPDSELQPGLPAEGEETPLTETSPSEEVAPQRDADAMDDGEAAVRVGSRFGTPEFDGLDDSGVLGPPRPAPEAKAPEATTQPTPPAGTDAELPRPPEPVPPVPALTEPPSPTGSAHLGDAPRAPEPPLEPETQAQPEAPPPPLDDDEPLWKRLAREQGTAPAAPAPQASDDEPLWKRFATSDLAARLPAPPPSLADEFADDEAAPASPQPDDLDLDALERRVLGEGGQEGRGRYVAELFGGSPDAYHRTLAQIDRAPTYTKATSIFSAEVFLKHRVDPYTDAAVAFIDAVQTQFERRG